MRVSTIFKAVATVVAISLVGVKVYSKVKENKTNEVESEVKTEETVEDDSEEDSITGFKDMTIKQRAVVIGTAVIGGLLSGFFLLWITTPLRLEAIYRRAVCYCVERAIDNGNLTFEELIDLAHNVSQEAV